jgi:hypothetical protein
VPDSAGEEVRAGEQASDQPSAGAEVPGQAGGRLRICRRPQVHHRPGQSGEKGNFVKNTKRMPSPNVVFDFLTEISCKDGGGLIWSSVLDLNSYCKYFFRGLSSTVYYS